jgi:hypothetical protein
MTRAMFQILSVIVSLSYDSKKTKSPNVLNYKAAIYEDGELENKSALVSKLGLFIKLNIEGEGNFKEFKEAFKVWGPGKVDNDGNHCYLRMVDPPQVLLIRIYERNKDVIKSEYSTTIPLEFELAGETSFEP